MKSTINNTLRHVLFLAKHLDVCDLRGAVIVILMELRVPTKSIGFEFLKKAILLQYKNPTRALAKDIYLEMALHYMLSSEEQVDQAIRDAIRSAWKLGSKEAWDWYFSYGDHAIISKPTNSEFISRIAYILELLQGCSRGEDRYER